MALEMKYFVLKPVPKTKDDKYALASREAMRTYATIIETVDPDLSLDIKRWIADIEDQIYYKKHIAENFNQ